MEGCHVTICKAKYQDMMCIILLVTLCKHYYIRVMYL